MKKLFSVVVVMTFVLSMSAFASDKAVVKKVKVVTEKVKVAAEKAKTDATKAAAALKAEVPCDSKEDILKKLEERKKAEAATKKAFSLQGGDTGCTIK